MKETVAGTFLIKQRESYNCLPAVRHFNWSRFPTHTRFHPTWMSRVYFDFGVSQLMGQVKGKRIERGFRRILGKVFGFENR